MSYTYSSFNRGTFGDFDSTYANFCQMADWLQNYLGLFFETVQANYTFPYVDTTISDDDEEETEDTTSSDDDEEETEDTTETTTSSTDIFSSYSSYPNIIAANGEYGIVFYYDTSAYEFCIDIWTLAEGNISCTDKDYKPNYGTTYGVASDYGIIVLFEASSDRNSALIMCKTNLDHVSVIYAYNQANYSYKHSYYHAILDGFNSTNGTLSIGVKRSTPMTVLVPYPLYSDEYLVGVYRMVFDQSSSYVQTRIALYSINNEIFATWQEYEGSIALKC